MIGLGFVCLAIFMVGGSLILTLMMTLLAMRHAVKEELAAERARTEWANQHFFSQG